MIWAYTYLRATRPLRLLGTPDLDCSLGTTPWLSQSGSKALPEKAASLGHYAVALMYPDDVSASVCDEDQDPKAFEDLEWRLFGAEVRAYDSRPAGEHRKIPGGNC